MSSIVGSHLNFKLVRLWIKKSFTFYVVEE